MENTSQIKFRHNTSYLTLITCVLIGIAVGLTIYLAHAATPPTPVGQTGNWNLIFDDEFNGTSLDTTTWTPNWFGNGNTQNGTVMDTSNVSESGGYLNLTLNGNTGGLVSTNPDDGVSGHTGFQYAYGYAEARIYLPASGNEVANWPAWWTDGQDWPTDGEQDIMEGLGGPACYHFHDTAGGPGGCASGNYSGWHVFGAYWQPGSVTYYYDGVEVGQIASGITSEPQYLVLENSAAAPAVSPTTMEVDYVRVWTYAGASTTTPDTTPPTVSLTSPANGSTVSGVNDIAATASDNVGVTKVTFAIDGNVVATDTAAPYTYNWDTTSAVNGSHTVTVTAYDAAGNNSAATAKVTVKNADTQPPTVPSGVTAKASAYNNVNVGWTAATDNVGVTGYYILRSSNGGTASTIGQVNGTTTSYTDTTTQASTKYGYQIEAYDAAGNISAASTAVSVTTPAMPVTVDTTPPTISLTSPTNSQTVSGTTSVAATASDNVGVTKVTFAIDGSIVSTVTTAPYTYSWNTTATANGSHIVTATAYDAAGNNTAATATVTVKNADTQPPTVPSGVTAKASAYNKVSLSWKAATDNVGVTGYYILRSTPSTAGAAGGTTTTPTLITIGQVNGTTTSYTDTTTQASTKYGYQIEAYDAAGNISAASTAVSVTTPAMPVTVDTTPPTAPSNLTASVVSSSQINLSWSASSDNVGVTGYEVYQNGTKLTTVTTTTFGDTNLKTSTKYSFYILAVDAAGNVSKPSGTVTAKTLSKTTKGTIKGQVVKSSNNTPIANVEVAYTTNGTNQYTYTNSGGAYSLSNIQAGSYKIVYSHSSYTSTSSNINVPAGEVVTENIALSRAK